MSVQNLELHDAVDATIISAKSFEAKLVLLQKCKDHINRVNADGDSPLHIISKNTLSHIYLRMIDWHENQQHLQWSDGLVEALLFNGADPNLVNNAGYTPLQLLMRCKCTVSSGRIVPYAGPDSHSFTKIRLLLDAGANADAPCPHCNNTPLHIVATQADRFFGELLIEKGANVNAVNGDGKQPLQLLLDCIYHQVQSKFCGAGVLTSIQHTGAFIKTLAKSGADFNADGVDVLLIHWLNGAARWGYKVEPLISDILESEKSPKLTIKGAYGWTFAHLAAVIDSVALLDAYIAHNGNIDARGYYDTSSRGLLLKRTEKELKTPLQVACERKSYNVVRALVSHGAHLDVVDSKNNSVFDLLLADGSAEQYGINAIRPLRCLCAKFVARSGLQPTRYSPKEIDFLQLHSMPSL